MSLPWFIYLAAFAAVSALPVGFWSFNDPMRRHASAARKNHDRLQAGDARQIALAANRRDRLIAPVIESISARVGVLAPSSVIEKTDKKLRLAGKDGAWTPHRMLAFQVIGLGAGIVLGLMYFAGSRSGMNFIFALSFAFTGFKLPLLLVTRKGKSRQASIQRDLPDILDQITITVEAGLGFDAALSRVAKESAGALAEELGRTMQDVQLGVEREEAFSGLLDRTDAPDLKQFVTALQQAARLGMPLGKVLRSQSVELRQRRRARAEEKAMKLGVKMTFPTVTCILPALLCAVMGPAVIQIMDGGLTGGS